MFAPGDIPRWGSFGEDFADEPYIQRQQLETWGIADRDWDAWSRTATHYYGIIAQVDDAFGRVLAALEDNGAADRTVVIFTADHGDMCGGHRMIDKHYVMYDDVVRVPLAIRMPGTAGRRSDAFVSNMLDLGPTLLDCAGLPVPDGLHGCSLLPHLRGVASPVDERDTVVST